MPASARGLPCPGRAQVARGCHPSRAEMGRCRTGRGEVSSAPRRRPRGIVGMNAKAEAGWATRASMNNVPDPLLAGKELPTFKFALEKSEGKVIGGSSGKEATVKQLPISKGIAGVSMRLEPGGDARAALARHGRRVGLRHRGPRPHHGHRPAGQLRDQRLRAGRHLVLPPRPRPHAPVPRRQALPLHPDLRQRLLLRVRHLQHHRLDRPHPQGPPGEELRPARVGLRRLPQGRGLLRPRAGAARASRRPTSQGSEAAAADAQVPAARPGARTRSTRAAASGGSAPTGSRSRRPSPA